MRLLLFAPALAFGLVAVITSALALRGDQVKDPEGAIARSRLSSQVAVIAAVLCGLSLLVGGAIFVVQSFGFSGR
ncbi:MAG TPA: hypothetical protein VFT79_13225 [Solirubrobacterales bacterium]|nr:hypothetical protein [Solirubrobacterales bacterium]